LEHITSGSVVSISIIMSSSDMPKVEDLELEKDYQTYKLGNFGLKSGGEILNAFIAYKTLGDPSLPAIIYPTWYSGCKYH
jgi:homoserine acetyltransferase